MKNIVYLWLLVVSMCLTHAAAGALVVTEVMSSSSHPSGADADWFEIYNSGASAVNLAGYTWRDDKSPAEHTNLYLPAWTLPAGATLIVVDGEVMDADSFRAMWGLASNSLVYSSNPFWGLGAGGDFVKILDPGQNEVASATFGAATAGATFQWSREGTFLGTSQAGYRGAYVAPSNGFGSAGTDVGSPGITVSIPTLSTYVLAMLPAQSPTANVNQAVALHTRSISNGQAFIGYGRTVNGSGWTWTSNLVVSSSGSLYYASATLHVPAPGTYYYAAQWTFDGFACYGWNAAGQTNAIILAAEQSLHITNALRAPYPGEIIITEIMSDSSHTNTKANGDWFEVYYTGAEPATLLGCTFDDSDNIPGLNMLSNVTLLPNSVVVLVDEDDDNLPIFVQTWTGSPSGTFVDKDTLLAGGFQKFSSSGDALYFYDPFDELITSVAVGPASNGFSFYWPPETDPFSPGMPTISTAGIEGAWRAQAGSDVGSPGVVVPEPAAVLLLLAPLALRRRAA